MACLAEQADRRKQEPVRGAESRSKRIRFLFGIWGRLERSRGLEGRYRLATLRAYGNTNGGPVAKITEMIIRGTARS